jgi:hypothetical protein
VYQQFLCVSPDASKSITDLRVRLYKKRQQKKPELDDSLETAEIIDVDAEGKVRTALSGNRLDWEKNLPI